MSQETIPQSSWRTQVFVTGSVLLTVLLALLLAGADSLQRQILPSPIAMAITNLNATPTNTPPPAILLATGAPTAPGGTVPAGDLDTAVAVLRTCRAAPPDWVQTSINPGETLFDLSLRSNVSAEKIRLANCLEPGSLLNLTALYLPNPAAAPVPTPPCGPPPSWRHYVVQHGETMFRLALRSGTSIAAILNANCLTSTNLLAGQRIFLPPMGAVPPTAVATPTNTATATATATPTATTTGTATGTATIPPLPTNTATATSTATGTPTASPTSTATGSTTPTASVTATTSPTASSTPSATPTTAPTDTATSTPSATPVPTDTATPTATATETATATATAAPTETPTP
ncbi:MAG: LysM peptidoglycan-binding domain-containing protein [Anaerolineaceae bacterium]|nr:LysM peptidoglycan-binding domain-containing protein [Anaerolineaceae bacterium]